MVIGREWLKTLEEQIYATVPIRHSGVRVNLNIVATAEAKTWTYNSVHLIVHVLDLMHQYQYTCTPILQDQVRYIQVK